MWDQYGHSLYITVLISVDATTLANGCLEVVPGRHLEGLFGPKEAPIPDEVVATFDWEQVETAPGDIVFFDSYVPHRSGPNHTDQPRRVLYVTYNKLSEGEVRERYFADKRKSFPPDCERAAGRQYQYKV